jgi:hypothetical protein
MGGIGIRLGAARPAEAEESAEIRRLKREVGPPALNPSTALKLGASARYIKALIR